MKKLIAKIRDFDGSNPITLNRADDISVFETVNSSDEGGSFTLPSNDPKISEIDYTKWWEIWDGESNTRLNYGPLHTIEEGNEKWTFSGPGRSQILEDLIATKHTFYYPVNRFLDDLRYENVATEPRTVTWVYGYSNQPETSNPKYYGLSKKSGNNAIDDTVVFTANDQRLPAFHTTDSFWSGTDKADGITVNLGQSVDVSRVALLFPWWGGYKRFTDRTYDFSLQYSTDADNFTTVVTKSPNYTVTADRYGGFYFYFRASGNSDVGYEPLAEWIQDAPINAKFWRIDISATHAWYGNAVDNSDLVDDWAKQCTPPPVNTTTSGVTGSVILQSSEPGSIGSKDLRPENDCHASIVEVGIYQEVIGKDQISNLVYQQVDNTSNQISYFHTYGDEDIAAGAKKVSTLDGHTLTRYEPGNFMKRVRFSWAGAGAAFTKFFTDDPAKSMTSSVVAVVDQNNSLVYRSLLTSGEKDLILPAYTQFIQIKGATGVNIINCDTWLGEANAFSVGNTLSVSVHAGDTAVLHFRGATLKMFVTTPPNKQGGSVRLSLRTKGSDGTFGGWTVLQDSVAIPNDVSNYKVYEIRQEDDILDEDGIYEFKVENLGGYVGLDAFAGYWQASWIDLNEDDERVLYNDNAGAWTQIYDGRFSGGSMYKTNEFGAHMQFGFEGDRVQVFMAKGPNFGKATIYISGPGTYGHNIVAIPGHGNSIEVDTGSDQGSALTHYIPRYLVFDSKDYWPNGMPWQKNYNIHVRHLDTSTYTAKVNQSTDSLFDQPCIDCINEKERTIHKYIYIDGVSGHVTSGLSAKFSNQTHLSILKSISEAIQNEWRITEAGLLVRPRIGEDTDVIIKEGSQAFITHDLTNDISKVATLLYSNGADIDGLPLFTITEDKKNKELLGATRSRTQDFRDVADYFTLIGASRGELFKRRTPEQRLTIQYVRDTLPIDLGDSFIFVTKALPTGRRLRLVKITQNQTAANGVSYTLECEQWPQTA